MARGTKICRVCGKEYPCCGLSTPPAPGVFRWQNVACCPEHGAIYLKAINESRGIVDEVAKSEDEVAVQEEKDAVVKATSKRTKKKAVEDEPVKVEIPDETAE